jgi:anion-transporting  ArsA/GET3 family ATPase
MSQQPHRLYIITGKGGVGKTSLAMALTKHLEEKGTNVKYNCFYQSPEPELWDILNLPVLEANLFDSAEMYIGKKLRSQTIASWIMKTHFFKSLFQMIPGLGHMILLGRLIEELQNDPTLTIVLDSPASGHALTMFESSSNFKKIFGSGLIVKDIDRMQNFLANKNSLKTFIVAIATELALTEAMDLKTELETSTNGLSMKPEIIINDSFAKYIEKESISADELPEFLQLKVALEQSVLNYATLPHIDFNQQDKVINELKLLMGTFV